MRSPIAKFLSEDELALFRSEPGSTVLFAADEPAVAARVLGALRLHLGRELELIDDEALLALGRAAAVPDDELADGGEAAGWPVFGQAVAHDADSYRYLAESIRKHPDQATLASMMEDAGFLRVSHRSLAGGIVAIHSGYAV